MLIWMGICFARIVDVFWSTAVSKIALKVEHELENVELLPAKRSIACLYIYKGNAMSNVC